MSAQEPMGADIPPELCEHCSKRPAAFRVKHRQTCRHWRCMKCFRELATHSAVIVTGWVTPRDRAAVGLDLALESSALDLLWRACALVQAALKKGGSNIST